MNRLKDADLSWFDATNIVFTNEEKKYLETLSNSKYSRDRNLCLDYIEESIFVRKNRNFNLEMIDKLILDKNNDIRWHAFCALGDFVEDFPHKVWPFVIKYGSHRSRDMRLAVSCCLLEHILEYHFDEYFPKVEKIITNGDKKFLFTLTMCWYFGEAEKNSRKINTFIEKAEEFLKIK